MKTTISTLFIIFIFLSDSYSQTEVTKSHIAIRPGFSLSNFENHLRSSIIEYFEASRSDVLSPTEFMDSPIIPHLSIEFSPKNYDYFIHFRYQPLFFNYNMYRQIEYDHPGNGQSHLSKYMNFSLAFQNNSYSLAIGKMYFDEKDVNIRIYGGASYNTSRTIFKQRSINSRSSIAFTPGVLAGFEIGFGKASSPLNLRFFIQQQLSGKTQIEGNDMLVDIAELNSTETIYLKPKLTHFSYVETGIYLSIKIQ